MEKSDKLMMTIAKVACILVLAAVVAMATMGQ